MKLSYGQFVYERISQVIFMFSCLLPIHILCQFYINVNPGSE